jgi:hypothetical protein
MTLELTSLLLLPYIVARGDSQAVLPSMLSTVYSYNK